MTREQQLEICQQADFTGATWETKSGPNSDMCIEEASTLVGGIRVVGLRDSKLGDDSPVLRVTEAELMSYINRKMRDFHGDVAA